MGLDFWNYDWGGMGDAFNKGVGQSIGRAGQEWNNGNYVGAAMDTVSSPFAAFNQPGQGPTVMDKIHSTPVLNALSSAADGKSVSVNGSLPNFPSQAQTSYGIPSVSSGGQPLPNGTGLQTPNTFTPSPLPTQGPSIGAQPTNNLAPSGAQGQSSDNGWWNGIVNNLAPALPALISGGVQLIGNSMATDAMGKASKEVSDVQSGAYDRAAQVQNEQFDKALGFAKDQYAQQRADQAPWLQSGASAVRELEGLRYDPLTAENFQEDPGYQFRLKQGLKGVMNSLAARGGLMGGRMLKGLDDYNQGMASQEWGNAQARHDNTFLMRLNPLQARAGFGQTAANQLGQGGQQFANNAGNMATGAGNALANGILGSANARAQGITDAGNISGSSYAGAGNILTDTINRGYNNYQGQQIIDQWKKKNGG